MYGYTLVYTPGTPRVPHFLGPYDTIPSMYQIPDLPIGFIKGPPLSPLQESLPGAPPAQIWFPLMVTPLFCLNISLQRFCSKSVRFTFNFIGLLSPDSEMKFLN